MTKMTKFDLHPSLAKTNLNEASIPNVLDRDFNNKKPCEAVASDLTYARVRVKWHYVCILLDL